MCQCPLNPVFSMPLIIDPSSTCDICLEKYSSQRHCYAIRCGHIFCGQCLSQINGHACPLCRAKMRRSRKLCVDFAPAASAFSTSSCCAASVHQQKQLKDLLDEILEIFDKRTPTVRAATGIAQRARALLQDLPGNPNQFCSIRILVIQALVVRLSIVLMDHELISLAQKASYETRIQELEKAFRSTHIKLQCIASKGESSANRAHQSQGSCSRTQEVSSARSYKERCVGVAISKLRAENTALQFIKISGVFSKNYGQQEVIFVETGDDARASSASAVG